MPGYWSIVSQNGARTATLDCQDGTPAQLPLVGVVVVAGGVDVCDVEVWVVVVGGVVFGTVVVPLPPPPPLRTFLIARS